MTDSPNKPTRELIQEGLTLFHDESSPDDDADFASLTPSAIKAFELFREATERGDCVGEFMLGVCYDFGRGVALDQKEAYKRYQNAANQGLPESWHNLGLCEMFGEGTPQNFQKGAEAFKRAFEAGCLKEANYNLALCLDGGVGVEPDEASAQELYRSLADSFAYSPARRRVIAPRDPRSDRYLLAAFFMLLFGIGGELFYDASRKRAKRKTRALILGGVLAALRGLTLLALEPSAPLPAPTEEDIAQALAPKIRIPYSVNLYENEIETENNDAEDARNVGA